MKELKNRLNRSGRKVYKIKGKHQDKKADHLEDSPPEQVTLSYNGGMVSADRGELGTWRVSERFNLSSTEKFETFEEAAREFERRTGEEPATPRWREES